MRLNAARSTRRCLVTEDKHLRRMDLIGVGARGWVGMAGVEIQDMLHVCIKGVDVNPDKRRTRRLHSVRRLEEEVHSILRTMAINGQAPKVDATRPSTMLKVTLVAG